MTALLNIILDVAVLPSASIFDSPLVCIITAAVVIVLVAVAVVLIRRILNNKRK